MATTIDEIRTLKQRKGQGQRAKVGQSKTYRKCGTSYLPKECPAWGKKCHKCGNKNHFSTYCRSKEPGAGTESPIAHPEDVRAKVSHIVPGLEASW